MISTYFSDFLTETEGGNPILKKDHLQNNRNTRELLFKSYTKN